MHLIILKMKKTMMSIILGIALISLASATTIYSGECLPVNLSELESLDNVVYDVVGNSSNMDGLTIELNGTIANICTVPNYKSDSFVIIFIDDSTKEVIKEIHVGGGGRTVYKDKNVTVYVPAIIKEPFEVEKIITINEAVSETKKRLRDNLLPCASGLLFGLLMIFIINKVLKFAKKKQKKGCLDDV